MQYDETEEHLTCLHIQLYHPLQASRRLYAQIPLNRRLKQQAEDPLRLGRDQAACTFVLNDQRVSRKQLSVQAFRSPHCSELLFQVQNLSRRGTVSVDGAQLKYLHWAELPGKALVRFADYQLLVWQEAADGLGAFEVEFSVLPKPPCQETGDWVPCGTPVMDGGGGVPLPKSPSPPSPPTPLETDEEMFLS